MSRKSKDRLQQQLEEARKENEELREAFAAYKLEKENEKVLPKLKEEVKETVRDAYEKNRDKVRDWTQSTGTSIRDNVKQTNEEFKKSFAANMDQVKQTGELGKHKLKEYTKSTQSSLTKIADKAKELKNKLTAFLAKQADRVKENVEATKEAIHTKVEAHKEKQYFAATEKEAYKLNKAFDRDREAAAEAAREEKIERAHFEVDYDRFWNKALDQKEKVEMKELKKEEKQVMRAEKKEARKEFVENAKESVKETTRSAIRKANTAKTLVVDAVKASPNQSFVRGRMKELEKVQNVKMLKEEIQESKIAAEHPDLSADDLQSAKYDGKRASLDTGKGLTVQQEIGVAKVALREGKVEARKEAIGKFKEAFARNAKALVSVVKKDRARTKDDLSM